MSKPIASGESSIEDVLYRLNVNGLQLLQPCTATKRDGSMWVLVQLQEVGTRRVFAGEGPFVWDAVNDAFFKAKAAGLRNSRLS